jgi:NAD(P)H dehydrogenase (quinone)
MKIIVILAHPHQGSFNHAIAGCVCRTLTESGHTVSFHDLYEEGFDPVLPYREIPRDALLPDTIQRHCTEIAEAGGLVFVHPDWWGMPPAILKGWVDRVLRPGLAYRFSEGDGGEGVPEGLLKVNTALVLNTSNTPAARETEVFGDPLERLWRDCICRFCGVKNFRRRMFQMIVTSSESQRVEWLSEVRELTELSFPRMDHPPI